MASKVPRNLGIVLDGNRRYARKLGLKPWLGHELGVKKLEKLFGWCGELGIKELTLYSFSTENFNRAKREIDFLFGLFKKKFDEIKKGKDFMDKGIKVNAIGRLDMFPPNMRKVMLEVMEKTKNNKKLTVNFALAYGGRQEIIDAVRNIARDVEKGRIKPESINEGLIAKNLYLQNEPDLVIRSGGEIRTSNFLMWQSAYSEWVFIKKLWPEFTKHDLMMCIGEFNKRKRRFGK
ncbi:di-trans,poly-cis-decaprenylcistransferase [Candidatus Woesearchaeota archaeon]|nr:di-trans,poly-cis-decaprenylcistransferase [Candidatus Woesearchaeota archaeon]